MTQPYQPEYHANGQHGMTAADEGHLNTLGILHYVWGGLLLLCGAFPLIYTGLGIAALTGNFTDGGDMTAQEPKASAPSSSSAAVWAPAWAGSSRP